MRGVVCSRIKYVSIAKLLKRKENRFMEDIKVVTGMAAKAWSSLQLLITQLAGQKNRENGRLKDPLSENNDVAVFNKF
jgi:hypothetical protein